ncbi:hypothetical protein IMCC3135_01225 [Granulosicoccus antarcticus IMCC3135]|uniref:Uncharacterized protein n=1 Tax=Granulosicoccus antarcticus IMCC3135 TaxID=1192854 RepID=A0A2Z2NTC0_9GAMM|nr:hypothetical protein IMCC3135_01225 [Granulosicoccus antarcticus IMCC3135]
MKCGSCQYFADYTDLRLGLRCMNKMNSPIKGDFMILDDDKSSCSHDKAYSPENLFEWDENKNRKM